MNTSSIVELWIDKKMENKAATVAVYDNLLLVTNSLFLLVVRSLGTGSDTHGICYIFLGFRP